MLLLGTAQPAGVNWKEEMTFPGLYVNNGIPFEFEEVDEDSGNRTLYDNELGLTFSHAHLTYLTFLI